MKVIREELDSRAFGRNVLQIVEPEPAPDFKDFETGYLAAFTPFYVYVKIPAEGLPLIHYFEDQGFRFMEFQLRMSRRLPRRKFDTAMFDEVLALSALGPDDDLEPTLRLADEVLKVDRVFMDPALPEGPASKRYRLYITNSWKTEDEEVLNFHDRRSGQLVSFHTHKYLGEGLVLTFLGGTARECQGSGLSRGCTLKFFNHWIERGVRRVRTHISLTNYKIMEDEYKGADYKAEQSFAILRKIYGDRPR